MTDDRMIAALLRERAGLASQGRADRVSLVDEQLKIHGYEAPAEAEKTPAKKAEDPKRQAPQGRTSRTQSKTD